MANTYLTKTFSGAPTNAKKGTISVWFKLGNNDNNSGNAYYRIFATGADNVNRSDINITNPSYSGAATLNFTYYNTASQEDGFTTNFKFRDFGAYYHLVIAYDTTQATASNRVKIYVNGNQLTGFSTENYPEQNDDLHFGNNSTAHHIGNSPHFATRFFQGIMTHFHYCDGYTYQASDFGSTDSVTGEWKINTGPSVQYGNNGFFILKDSNSVTDQSGNSNNFTVAGGTLTTTQDNPSNNFATLNPLIKSVSSLTFSNGNTTLTTSGSQWEGAVTTLAPHKGKWYWEAKYNTGSGIKLDIARMPEDLRNMGTANQSYLAYHGDGYGYQLNNSGTDYYCANNSCTTWNSSVNGNSTKIYMVAVDLDNGKMWIGANGTWANSSGTANPATGADPRHSFSAKLNGDPWLFSMSLEGGSGSHNVNFGNGYFGTTAVSSAGTNASGVGIFEYDVPAGYTALCTKGLNSF